MSALTEHEEAAYLRLEWFIAKVFALCCAVLAGTFLAMLDPADDPVPYEGPTDPRHYDPPTTARAEA